MNEHMNNYSNVFVMFMNQEDVCQIKVINKKKVNKVKKQLMKEEIFLDISETFKTLGDKTRIKILYSLSKEELCVCDISTVIEMSTSLVSHQLRLLRDKKLVKYRKQGKSIFYSLDDDHVVELLKMAFEHVNE
jgi:DNA-binding transcriptional ArsR family regulator